MNEIREIHRWYGSPKSKISLWMSCLAILWSVVSCEPSVPHRSWSISHQPIIGGQPDLRHPAVGALTLRGQPFCTGSLIASRVVLTAAHCIDAIHLQSSTGTIQFRIDLSSSADPQGFISQMYDVDLKSLSTHPQWQQIASNGYDIGVAILQQRVAASDAQPIPYNTHKLDAQWIGKELLFLGYGLIESVPAVIPPNRKYGAEIPIVNVDNDRITHQATGKSVCHGDSGGPALFTINGQLRIIAINSHVTAPFVPGSNPPRSTCDAAGVSMRTDTYRPYLDTIMLQYGDGPSACTQDSDCGVCGQCNQQKLCEHKPLPTSPSTCRPCRDHSDCISGGGICHRFTDGFRCIEPCDGDLCCPTNYICTQNPTVLSGTGGSGISAYCMPHKGQCGQIKCNVDADCGLGEICDGGNCQAHLPPRSAKLCQACQSYKDCDSPAHLCVGPQQKGQCLQPCGVGDFCPEGLICRSLYPGTPKQCLAEDRNCRIPCLVNTNCPAGWSCEQEICHPQGGGKKGDLCNSGSCQSGLKCVQTLSGDRCLQPCGIPNGQPGSFCLPGNQCADGAQCVRLSTGQAICLKSCLNDSDCANSGGGICHQNFCFCQVGSHCQAGYVCNTGTQMAGACARDTKLPNCATGEECRATFAEGAFCVPVGGGVRSLGEKCDSLNRCLPGLACIMGNSGAFCIEDCSTSQNCILGGKCINVGGISLCLCDPQASDCHTDRTCIPVVQTQGICRDLSSQPKCLGDSECPPGFYCAGGQCLERYPLSEPNTESPPNSEPSTEPSTSTELADAGSEWPEQTEAQNEWPDVDANPDLLTSDKAEAVVTADISPSETPVADKPVADLVTLDSDEHAENTNHQVPQGCTCNITDHRSGHSLIYFLLLLLPISFRKGAAA